MKIHKKKEGSENDFGLHANAERELFAFAYKLRRNMTETEKLLWEFLRTKPRGYKFRRQHPFGQYIFDFYCHSKRLAIEVDGPYHDIKKQQALDEIRTEVIISMGITELRFTDEEIRQEIEMVKKVILEILEAE